MRTREQTALIKEFNESLTQVNAPKDRKKSKGGLWGEADAIVLDAFQLPDRNWNALIDDYNAANKKKFPLTALQCKVIIEFVKRGVPPQYIFETLGYSNTKYSNMINNAAKYEDRKEQLAIQPSLSDDEYEEFHSVLRNPTRILMEDIARAKGLSNLADWEIFNEASRTQPDILMAKMKAKFKDIFAEKDAQTGATVQINISGNWLAEL